MSKPVDSILYTCTKCGIVFGFNKDGGMINHEGTFCKRCTRIELSKPLMTHHRRLMMKGKITLHDIIIGLLLFACVAVGGKAAYNLLQLSLKPKPPKPPTTQDHITTLSARQSLQEERMLSIVNGTCEGYQCHDKGVGE
jgi:hypothetical protein